jgi:hypothetical protein
LNCLIFLLHFILCCFINLRINTTSKMFFIINSTISKTNLIFKKFDDWDEWILIIKMMTRRDDVEKYVNLIKIESAEFIEFDLFIFFTIKLDAINSIELSIDEQRNLAIMRQDYKKKYVNIKNKSTRWKIWTFSYWRQLIDSILFISKIKRRFIKNYQRWRNVSFSRIEFENSRWFANTKICKKRLNINKWINDCWIKRRFMRKRNDWICLMCKTIDAHTIFWIRCERWIYHLCLKEKRFSIMKWIRTNSRRQ